MTAAGSFNFSSSQIDLSGKLIIKAQLGDDIRRIPIHNEDITYDELLLMMQRLFRGKIKNTDDVLIKYKDEDGDLITIFDSSDLSFAKSVSRYLKITLFVNGKPRPLEHDQVKEIKEELLSMRGKLNNLLCRLDSISEERVVNKEFETREAEARKEQSQIQGIEKPVIEKKQQPIIDGKAHAAMFDPLKSVKSEADSTLSSETKPDPFADIGQQSKPSPLSSAPTYQPTASDVPPQPTYPSQQAASYQDPKQQSSYAPTYPSSTSVGAPAQQPSQYPTQQTNSQQNFYQTGDQAVYYPGQNAYAADKSAAVPAPVSQVPSSQFDQSGVQYSSHSYPIGNQAPGSYVSQSQYPSQAPQEGIGFNQPGGNQGYSQAQQQQQPQLNPYSRPMSPRQQYPQPAKGYDVYHQSQNAAQNMGYPQYSTQ